MKTKRSIPRLAAMLLITLVILATAACQLTSSPAAPSARTPKPGASTPTTEPVNEAKDTPAVTALPEATATEAKPAGGPGDFVLTDVSAGLDALGSYQQSLVTGFDGTVGGVETHSLTILRRTVIKDPPAEVTWMEIDGGPRQMFAKAGEVSYSQSGEEGDCTTAPAAQAADPAPSFRLESLPLVSGAVKVGEEEVNGMRAAHYTFDERALGLAGEVTAQGEVWIAKEGGFVAKYRLSLEGGEGKLGPGVQGKQAWAYDLSSPNAVSALDMPEGCAAGAGKAIVPLPEGAANVLRMPNFTQYTVNQSPEQVAQYYRDQAAALGWEEMSSEPPDSGDVLLYFKTADGGLVNLRASAEGDGARVTAQSLPGSGQQAAP